MVVDHDTSDSFQTVLPGILTAAIDPAVRRAGMIAVCTMIGPVPEAGGQIMATTYVFQLFSSSLSLISFRFSLACSLQFGDSPDTPLFSQAWLEHDKSYVEALAKFAVKHEYRTSTLQPSLVLKSHFLTFGSVSGGALCEESSRGCGRWSSGRRSASPRDFRWRNVWGNDPK